MKLNITRPQQVEAKTLRIHCKVRDTFEAYILDADGKELGGQEDGYVPSFMPEDHYGDYLILNIDLDTGMVTNWKKPSPEAIETFINRSNDE